MKAKKYKIGEFVIQISTPSEYEDKKPFSEFLCENQKADYEVEFEFAEKIEYGKGRTEYSSELMRCESSGEVRYCFYKSGDDGEYYACRINKGSEPRCRVLIPEKYADKLWQRVIFTVIGIEEIAAMNNAVVFHSSFIEKDGNGILFTGPCGIGKTTQAKLWEKYGNAEIINGDKTLIYEKNGIITASGLPYSGSSPICKNKAFPLKAIVKLEKALYNKAEKPEGMSAFLDVYKSCYPIPCVQELTNRQIDIAQKISEFTTVYNFKCLPDESAVKYLEDKIC